MMKGRRVFLDYRENPAGLRFVGPERRGPDVPDRIRGPCRTRPLERLRHMNPAAIELYREHGIDLARRAAGDRRLRPAQQRRPGGQPLVGVGEPPAPLPGGRGERLARRSTGPAGPALNSGQVGGFRAAEFIARRYAERTLDRRRVRARRGGGRCSDAWRWSALLPGPAAPWREERDELQRRMTRAGAHIRSPRTSWSRPWPRPGPNGRRLESEGCQATRSELREAWTTRQLCFAHLVYLEAIRFAGGKRRGQPRLLGGPGPGRDARPRTPGPGVALRAAESRFPGAGPGDRGDAPDGTVASAWVPRRPLPEDRRLVRDRLGGVPRRGDLPVVGA
ncbi:MAG: hypothetical protein MZV49_00265 [Rhodopseudomonas palustris]|nr:hypothetical protein [Rhodopseudomonas palustris]